uniref:Uncharacterized protein n=1 Tax=Opuntia streptacantha TaxID=393608 RepID=A0A7C9ECZ3_OPUST
MITVMRELRMNSGCTGRRVSSKGKEMNCIGLNSLMKNIYPGEREKMVGSLIGTIEMSMRKNGLAILMEERSTMAMTKTQEGMVSNLIEGTGLRMKVECSIGEKRMCIHVESNLVMR